MSYSEHVSGDYMPRNDYNCAETMLTAANEFYRLGLSERALHAASPFGGGMGREGACGALTGGLMALGCLLARERSHQDPELGVARDEFVRRFEERLGSLECAALKRTHRTEEQGCVPVVTAAAEILEEVVREARG